MVGGWGESVVELCMFENRKTVLVFLYHCISDGNHCFQKFGCHFHFIWPVMSDKAAFVSGALFCVQRYRGNLELSLQQRMNLHIYASTNSACLWDYGIHKLNSIIVSLQFML